jgi:hypothetical protein
LLEVTGRGEDVNMLKNKPRMTNAAMRPPTGIKSSQRTIAILGPIAAGQVPRDRDPGLRTIRYRRSRRAGCVVRLVRKSEKIYRPAMMAVVVSPALEIVISKLIGLPLTYLTRKNGKRMHILSDFFPSSVSSPDDIPGGRP